MKYTQLMIDCEARVWRPSQKPNIAFADDLYPNDLAKTIDFGGEGSVTFVATGAGYIYAQFEDTAGNIYQRLSFPHHYLFEKYILMAYRGLEWPETMWFPHYGESSLAHWRIMQQPHRRSFKEQPIWF